MEKQQMEPLLAKTREWKNFMVKQLSLPQDYTQKSFAEILTVRKLSTDGMYDLLALTMSKVGVFSPQELAVLHQNKGYLAVLNILYDTAIVPSGNIFWLNHPDYPEIVFEIIPGRLDFYRIYIVDAQTAALCRPEDGILLYIAGLGKLADVYFVEKIPAAVEEKRKKQVQGVY